MSLFNNKRKDYSIRPPRQQVNTTPFFVTDSANIDFTLSNLNLTADLTFTGVVAGTYGDATHIPILQIDQWGRVTGVTTTTFSASGILLETNSTANTSQTILNLTSGTDIQVVDLGGGVIKFNYIGTGGSGTVQQVNTGTGLTGGPITVTGTISLNSKLAPADNLTGNAGKFLAVNSTATAVEYVSAPTGTITSVNAGTNISVTGTLSSPTINSLSDRYKTSSTTSNSVSNGVKTFIVNADLSYIPLQEVLVVYDPANHMHGEVVSYSGTTLVVDIKNHTGSGTYTSWVINLDGTPVDAITGSGTINQLAYFTGAKTISSFAVSGDATLSNTGVLTIANNAVTYAKMQAVSATSKLLGSNQSTTAVQEITLGTGLSMTGNTLSATGSGGNSIASLSAASGDVSAAATSASETNVVATLKANLKTGSFGVTVDGVTGVVQVGTVGYVVMPYAGTITGWSITSNVVGTISFDITSASGAIPTVSIIGVGGNYPTLTSNQFITSTTMTSWTLGFSAGDVFGFSVRSSPAPSLIKNATLTIRTTKS